jgi:hypothetical protein
MSNIFNTVVNDADESLRSKSGGKFGLNSGFITKLEYNANAGKDSSEGDAVDITVQVGDKEFRRRIYDATGALYGKDNAQVAAGEPEYAALYNAEMKQRMAVVTHAVKATGTTNAEISARIATAVDFKSWAGLMCSLPMSDFKAKAVDVFVEYQWNISEGQEKTYLELPKNMKGGYFLCPAQTAVGSFKEVRNADGMHYADDAGNVHCFTRSKNFMDGKKANQQVEGQEETAGLVAAQGGTADKSVW